MKARRVINLMIDEIRDIVVATGIATRMVWMPPRRTGGSIQHVDVMLDLFNLERFDIAPNDLTDCLERAIGVYQSDQTNSLVRTCNPLWWMIRALKWFAHIPFFLIDAAGFNAVKAEDSLMGRLIKAIFLATPVIASLLTILKLMGWLDVFKTMIGLGT